MKVIGSLCRFVLRFRYPFSMPEDIAQDLGFNNSYLFTFNALVGKLTVPQFRSPKLKKFMPRSVAEEVFKRALRKEKFRNESLFSYHFQQGWMEFDLQFDEEARLRRLYLQHKELKQKVEIPLG